MHNHFFPLPGVKVEQCGFSGQKITVNDVFDIIILRLPDSYYPGCNITYTTNMYMYTSQPPSTYTSFKTIGDRSTKIQIKRGKIRHWFWWIISNGPSYLLWYYYASYNLKIATFLGGNLPSNFEINILILLLSQQSNHSWTFFSIHDTITWCRHFRARLNFLHNNYT